MKITTMMSLGALSRQENMSLVLKLELKSNEKIATQLFYWTEASECIKKRENHDYKNSVLYPTEINKSNVFIVNR